MREPSDYVDEFRELLSDLGAAPVVIGALAAGRYRIDPRLTVDVDFLVSSLEGVAAAMREKGYDVRVLRRGVG